LKERVLRRKIWLNLINSTIIMQTQLSLLQTMRIHAYAMTLLSDFDVDFEDRQFSNMKYIRYISFGATFIVEHFCYPTVALV